MAKIEGHQDGNFISTLAGGQSSRLRTAQSVVTAAQLLSMRLYHMEAGSFATLR
jgi:hypothetical protein